MNHQKLYASIRSHEGLRLEPYRDSVGKLTIGYGRNLDDVGITVPEAELMMREDLAREYEELSKLAVWPTLNDIRQNVLIEMSFNLGYGGLRGFRRMWAAVGRHDYERAASEMLDSKWASQVGKRAVRLAEMMKKGTW